MRKISLIIMCLLVASCAQHRLVVERPNPVDAPHSVNSTAYAFGTVQKRTVAQCDTNIIDEVRVHQNLGQALISVLTLGIVMPTKIEYQCGGVPSEEGSTDD